MWRRVVRKGDIRGNLELRTPDWTVKLRCAEGAFAKEEEACDMLLNLREHSSAMRKLIAPWLQLI
jgi:hypothetical protein